MSCKWDARVYLCRLCLIEYSGGASAHASAVFTGKTYVQACLTYVFIGWPILPLRFTHHTVNGDLAFGDDHETQRSCAQRGWLKTLLYLPRSTPASKTTMWPTVCQLASKTETLANRLLYLPRSTPASKTKPLACAMTRTLFCRS
jgi:hypothetical protein